MGERFGNYEILRRLAAGGMAEVLLAKHKSMGGFERLVCLKRILPHLSAQEEFLKMFQDEARIAANLVHPNIAQIYDISAVEDTYYIAMEYVRGEDLRRVYNQEVSHGQTIPAHVAALIIMGAAAGLNYAHRQVDLEGLPLNIVHRDISPQNILVTYDGHVKIIDFGVAKAAGKLNQTRAGVLKGKYSYMSPEQASGDPLDGRTDVFALGTTLYEITTGVRLFKRDNELETLHAVIACNVKPPSEIIPNYDTLLERIVLRALAYDVDARYTTAGEMEHDLERFLMSRGHPTSATSLAGYMQDLFAEKLADEALFGGHPWQEGQGQQRAPFVRPIADSTARTGPQGSPQPAPEPQGDESTTVDEEPTSRLEPEVQARAKTAHTDEGTPADWSTRDDAERTAALPPSKKEAAKRPTEDLNPVPAPPPETGPVVAIEEVGRQARSPRRMPWIISALFVACFLVLAMWWLRPRADSSPLASDSEPQAADEILLANDADGERTSRDESTADEQTDVSPAPLANSPNAATVDVLAPTPMAVTLGGHYLGDTPLIGLRLAAGVVRLRLEDHDTGLVIRKSVALRQDRRIRVEVPNRRGQLQLNAVPWAWVQIGQRPARETPQTLELIEGEYDVVMECPDGRRKTETARVIAGETARVTLKCAAQ